MITEKEKQILRDLAKSQAELAQSDKNISLIDSWYKFNDSLDRHPLIMVEYESFGDDLKPELICESDLARKIEEQLRLQLSLPELIGDDRVIPDFFSVNLNVHTNNYGLELKHHRASDGNNIAYKIEYPLANLTDDLHMLKPSSFSSDIDEARSYANSIGEIIGDILPVRIRNNSLLWRFALTQNVVQLMGMENFYLAMYEEPEELHQLMAFLRDDILAFVKWQEENGLLTPNWGNEHSGSNSYGFTNKLPTNSPSQTDLLKGKTDIRLSDLWINTNSQESVGISKECFTEFVLPYYVDICKRAGLVYYGCCEPVHMIFDGALDTLPNLRKLSVSPWCNEEDIAEKLQGKDIIYSRKPSPNYLGVGKELDEDAFCSHIAATLNAAKGLPLEFTFRDIYTLSGNIPKLRRAVDLVRNLIDTNRY